MKSSGSFFSFIFSCVFSADAVTKERAADALEAMGLSISDAIRLLMLRVADERRLPFEVKVPNSRSRRAIKELESGKSKKLSSVKALIEDLNVDDVCGDGVSIGVGFSGGLWGNKGLSQNNLNI
jgi:DNA-damage-inducible protein J